MGQEHVDHELNPSTTTTTTKPLHTPSDVTPKKKSDIPKRLATVSIGAPLILSLLCDLQRSTMLLFVSHVLCVWEWTTNLLPKVEQRNKQGQGEGGNEHCNNRKFIPVKMSRGMQASFLIFSLCMAHGTQDQLLFFLCLAVPWYYLMYPANPNEQPPNMQLLQRHCLVGHLYLSLGYHHLMQIRQTSLLHSLLFLLTIWNGDTGGLIGGRISMWCRLHHDDPLKVYFHISEGWTRWLKSVSPKKTWTGMMGSIVGGTMTVFTLPYLLQLALAQKWLPQENATSLDYPHLLLPILPSSLALLRPILGRFLVGIILSITGIAGDLVESCIKRRAQVSDAGKLIPGQGGVLDRMDSALIAAGVYFFLFLDKKV